MGKFIIIYVTRDSTSQNYKKSVHFLTELLKIQIQMPSLFKNKA